MTNMKTSFKELVILRYSLVFRFKGRRQLEQPLEENYSGTEPLKIGMLSYVYVNEFSKGKYSFVHQADNS